MWVNFATKERYIVSNGNWSTCTVSPLPFDECGTVLTNVTYLGVTKWNEIVCNEWYIGINCGPNCIYMAYYWMDLNANVPVRFFYEKYRIDRFYQDFLEAPSPAPQMFLQPYPGACTQMTAAESDFSPFDWIG
jgi:hypothetical protein